MNEEHEADDKLIHRYFDDSLSTADAKRLIDSLENSPQLRAQFVREALLNADLRDMMREADIRQFIASEEQVPAPQPGIRHLVSPGMVRWVVRGMAAAVILLAAAVAITQLGSQGPNTNVAAINPNPSLSLADEEELQPETPASEILSVGTLVQQANCRWTAAENAWRNGDPLPPNTVLSLESGAAEVALENGVRLVLSGPCKIQLVSEMYGNLFRGSLTAKVPPAAHGFTLLTPSSQVIDLGTEFGINVAPSGESEVHVFQGEVISRWHGGDGKGRHRSLRLREKNAVRFGIRESETALITADESRFVRDLAPRLSLEELPPLPVRDDLALWLAADRMIETDREGHVISWSDLLCDPSQSFQVACQLDAKARPKFIPAAMNGLPAVRFDGVDDFLVTTPLETTDCQTIFAVLMISPDHASLGQIINYNGPPHRQLRFPAIPGILQINARRYPDGAFLVRGLINTGWSPEGWTVDGDVAAKFPRNAALDNRPVLVCYRYDPAANETDLFINGALADKTSAPCPAGLTSRKVIGRRGYGNSDYRHLNGDLGELVIYNRALSDDQVAQVAEYLANRYDSPFQTATKARK